MATATRPRKKTAAPRAKSKSPARRAKKKAAPKPRASQPAKRAAASRRARKPSGKSSRAKAERLPGWADLASANTRALPRPASAPRGFIETITTAQFAFLLFVIAVLGTAYVGHTHATDRALETVQAERARAERLTMQRSRLQAELAAESSPQVILPRAKALGLEEGVAYGEAISLRSRGDVSRGEMRSRGIIVLPLRPDSSPQTSSRRAEHAAPNTPPTPHPPLPTPHSLHPTATCPPATPS